MASNEYKYQLNVFTGKFELSPTKKGSNFLDITNPVNNSVYGVPNDTLVGTTQRVAGTNGTGDDTKPIVTIDDDQGSPTITIPKSDMTTVGATVSISYDWTFTQANNVDYTIRSNNNSAVAKQEITNISCDTGAASFSNPIVTLPSASFDGSTYLQTQVVSTVGKQDVFNSNSPVTGGGRVQVTLSTVVEEVWLRKYDALED